MINDGDPCDSGIDGARIEEDLRRASHLLADLGELTDTTLDEPAEDTYKWQELFELSQSILRTLDFEVLLPRLLDLAIHATGAERGIFFHFDDNTGESRVCVVRGFGGTALDTAVKYSRTVLDDARARLQVVSSDTGVDARYMEAASVRLHDIRSVVCLPVANERRVLGAIYLDNQRSHAQFSARSIQLATILAGLAVTAVQNAETFGNLSRQNNRLAQEVSRYAQFDELIGRGRTMQDLLKTLERVSGTDFPILLQGESGSGKELVCRAIHRGSSRAMGPLIVQNCAAIPTELLESELFGHTRGAFTGAHMAREGLFRRAHGGTLFLDEIADLDIRLQGKLLRVLEDGKVRPVGSEEEHAVDFRLVSATSVDMKRAVESGRVRRDLYYRLNVVALRIPPLRERTADLPLLVHHFIEKHRASAGHRLLRFSPDALTRLQSLAWPGNVRELEHLVQRALVLIDRPVVEVADLARLLDCAEPGAEEKTGFPGGLALEELEAWAIQEALEKTGGNKARAAQLLRIHRNALLRKLEKHKGLPPNN